MDIDDFDRHPILFIGAVLIAITVPVIVGAMLLESASCKSRWEHSGFRTSWGPLQGCLVQRKDGSWVPSGMLRDINP